jgi:hypothetical protein
MQLCFHKTALNKPRRGALLLASYLVCELFFFGKCFAQYAEPEVLVSIDKAKNRWQVQASMPINLKPLAFIELLDSSPVNCDWMHNCKSVTLLAGPNANVRYIQTRIGSPWPFSDRLMITQSRIKYSADDTDVTVFIEPLLPSKEQEELANTVIIRNPRGHWQLLKKGPTHELSYIGSADIDSGIPFFILKRTLIKSTKKTFENIYNKVNKPREKPNDAQK